MLHKSTNTMACHLLIHPSIFKRGCENIPQIAMFNELTLMFECPLEVKRIDQLVHVHNYCCPTQPTSQSKEFVPSPCTYCLESTLVPCFSLHEKQWTYLIYSSLATLLALLTNMRWPPCINMKCWPTNMKLVSRVCIIWHGPHLAFKKFFI